MENKNAEFFLKRYGVDPKHATGDQRKKEYFRLRNVASERGYKPGWAAYSYEDLFGEKPVYGWRDEFDENTGSKGGNASTGSGMAQCPHCKNIFKIDEIPVRHAKRSPEAQEAIKEVKEKIGLDPDAMPEWDKSAPQPPEEAF